MQGVPCGPNSQGRMMQRLTIILDSLVLGLLVIMVSISLLNWSAHEQVLQQIKDVQHAVIVNSTLITENNENIERNSMSIREVLEAVNDERE